jgi:hypothetical protein
MMGIPGVFRADGKQNAEFGKNDSAAITRYGHARVSRIFLSGGLSRL